MPPAARVTDRHSCPIHAGGTIETGFHNVLIGNQPAAREADRAKCPSATDTIAAGEPSVLIANKPAARIGDPMQHGGVIVSGCPTVLIGPVPQANTLRTNKPFCEECEAKRLEREARRKRAEERGA